MTANLPDIEQHNEEARAVWKAFHDGKPIRPPVHLGTATQFFILNDDLNPGLRINFEQYSRDARSMLEMQLKAAVWRSEKIAPYCDDQIGLPEKFVVKVDLQTYDEAAYFGAPVIFFPDQVPDTKPILEGDKKNLLFDQGLPDPLIGGYYKEAHRIYAEMKELIQREPEYLGRPIELDMFGHYTEGPLTIAYALRGNELLTDLYDDPDYVRQLLDYVTEGVIARVQAHNRFFGAAEIAPDMFFADDELMLISNRQMKEFMVPVYKKLKVGLTTAEKIKIHLCGDATRHFKTLKEELGVYEFETGFPVDFGALRKSLGPEVLLHGGPDIMLLQNGPVEAIQKRVDEILFSGVCEGGRFVLREGNNLAPHTPFAHLDAMYQAARKFRY